jgi:hypothetical protein
MPETPLDEDALSAPGWDAHEFELRASGSREPIGRLRCKGDVDPRPLIRQAVLPVVLSLAASCTGAESADAPDRSPTAPVSSSTPDSTELPRIARKLRAPPTNCRGISVPITRDTPYGQVIGSDPVWAGFYVTRRVERGLFEGPDAPRTQYGWRIKVLWVMRDSQREPVAIDGANVHTGVAMWFEPVDQEAAPSASLDPAHPGAPSEEKGWLNFPSYVYFPGAGCYVVRAASSETHWKMVFAFGR